MVKDLRRVHFRPGFLLETLSQHLSQVHLSDGSAID
jgi:hypothetical protein